MAGRSQARLRYRDGADYLGRTAYSLGEASLKTQTEQQAAAFSRAGVRAGPCNTVAPAVTGTNVEGATKSCSTGTWVSATLDTKTYTYQWMRNMVFEIPGATANTYIPVQDDVGCTLSCRVKATDVNGSSTILSNVTSAVTAAAAPTNTVLPTITGTGSLGQTLTRSTGTWTSATAETPTYATQWKRAGVAISGATNSTYVVQAADVGTNVTVTVTATDSNGSTAATSTNKAIT